MPIEAVQFVPWIPFLGAILCCLCCTKRSLWGYAGPICVLSIFASFCLSFLTFFELPEGGHKVVTFFHWIAAGNFSADVGYYLDTLTYMMLFVVTGIGSLIAWYAMGYMKGDRGYARFFAGVSIFIFAMTNLVMADNLVLLYLGWEGVGFASWFLIGFYYQKPFAVFAAKKAFIVNRIGDLGFALGLFLTYKCFGSIEYADILPAAKAMLLDDASVLAGNTGAQAAYMLASSKEQILLDLIPFLLMLGAFGKSAQIPLYVWLPDAMAGPTPVSALVHAATMVTSGVYMISRLINIFELSPYALPTVAVIGGITCLFAATIALCNNDLKGVFAYSTVSQLGYMFIGVGALSTYGGLFHLFTHAFFKALLFLTAGSVMHALAGQLDIRKMRGMGKYMPVTKWLMLAGCVALAGIWPFAGFYSKDLILGDALSLAVDKSHGFNTAYTVAVVCGILTAGLTAFYTFRLWFMVFTGEPTYLMGDENHAMDEHEPEAEMMAHAEDEHGEHHHHTPHEMPWLTMNAPLVILAVGAIVAGFAFKGTFGEWVGNSSAEAIAAPLGETHAATHSRVAPDGLIFVADTTHAPEHPAAAGEQSADEGEHAHHHVHHNNFLGMSAHTFMVGLSLIIAFGGAGLAWLMYAGNNIRRVHALGKIPAIAVAVKVLQDKWYIDEIYDAVIVRPLRLKSHVFFVIDQLIIDGLVLGAGWLPGNVFGKVAQKGQSGRLQGYGLGMAAGLAVVAVLIFFVVNYSG